MTIELPLATESPRLEINLRNTPLTVEPSSDGAAWARFVPEHGEAPRHARERFAVRAREADDGGPPVATLEERHVEDPEKGKLRVQIPASTQLRLRSRNGAVQVRDLAGQLNARTRNGAIDVCHHRGPLRLAAANGAINLSDGVAAQLEVSAANGSVNLSDIETPRLQVATSNGRVRVARGRIGGGSVRCANGRIALQVAPLPPREPAADPAPNAGATAADAVAEPPPGSDAGADPAGHADGQRRLAVYSANGPISVALPEQVSATVKARTLGVMRNYLGSARTRTERGVTTLQFGSGAPELLVLINNLRGGIEVMKHADFETGRRDHEEEFSHHDPHHEGVWFDVDFSEEFPRFMRDMKEFGMKFGRLGEEVSREMRRAFKFGGPGARGHEHRRHRGHEERDDTDTRAEARHEDSGEEIKTVLNLLQEGKISVEDAEKLIAALRR